MALIHHWLHLAARPRTGERNQASAVPVPKHGAGRRGPVLGARRDGAGRLGGKAAVDPPPRLGRRMSRPTLARAALGLYPPSWRARYRDEVLMLLEDSGGRPREVAS